MKRSYFYPIQSKDRKIGIVLPFTGRKVGVGGEKQI
jgi:hypothetical protein